MASSLKRKRPAGATAAAAASLPDTYFVPMKGAPLVTEEDLTSPDVSLFLIRCPADFDVSTLNGMSLPADALSKRARLNGAYDLEATEGGEAAQLRVLLPGKRAKSGAGDDSDASDDEDGSASNCKVVSKRVAGTLQPVSNLLTSVHPLSSGLAPVTIATRNVTVQTYRQGYKYLPLGHGSAGPDLVQRVQLATEVATASSQERARASAAAALAAPAAAAAKPATKEEKHHKSHKKSSKRKE